MSGKSSIEWTDSTWNPVRGCSKVSAGCTNCYAMAIAARFSGPGMHSEGFATMKDRKPYWTGKVALVEEHLTDPLRWKKPRRIFVNSMSDLFHEGLPDDSIDRVFAVMTSAQHHTFQVLTKRPQRMLAYLSHTTGPGNVLTRILDAARAMPKFPRWIAPESHDWPYRNVHLGVSVEDQATADERIPSLLQTPAAVRFVSYEPALGPVTFREIHHDGTVEIDALTGDHGVTRPLKGRSDARLDWVIVGGESGPHARPFDVAWARSTVAQCKAAGVACFVKQLGARALVSSDDFGHRRGEVRFCDRKGGDATEWPKDLRVREFPAATTRA